ncbi:MAG: hypothetical protein P4N41_15750 [Negativicutes bacterium]|nr:hypothetical protein [Negativicutes bacterium]MDR3591108.1 hypothetical protein [Negativicutes bacterium]
MSKAAYCDEVCEVESKSDFATTALIVLALVAVSAIAVAMVDNSIFIGNEFLSNPMYLLF